jgi:hypothetical protein
MTLETSIVGVLAYVSIRSVPIEASPLAPVIQPTERRDTACWHGQCDDNDETADREALGD